MGTKGYVTSSSGMTIYRGAAYPEQYYGNAFIGEVAGNLVMRYPISPDGVTFQGQLAHHDSEFLASTDNWIRPVNFINAPDGTLHVWDMYRETIEHPWSMPEDLKAQVDLTSGRDRGRIYRLIPGRYREGFVKPPVPRLGTATTKSLVAELANPNSWWRETAHLSAIPGNEPMRPFDRRAFLSISAGGVTSAMVSRANIACSATTADGALASDPFRTSEHDRIWDLHCHFSGVSGQTVEQRAAQLLEYADRMHVERLVFFMGWPWSQTPEPVEFRKQNDQVLRVLEKWPDRVFGFAYLNASFPDESLAEIERCINEGPMLGVKLWVGKRCSTEDIDPLIRRCGELNALVFQHTFLKVTGNLPGESTPQDLAQLAARHPNIPLICGHTGGDWTLGIRAIREFPNVSVGIGGSDPTAGFVEMAVRELGAERVLYGSDIGGRSFASQLAKVYGAEITDDQRKLILGGNLRRMLKPIMQSKGIQQ